jgi:hypothetical protein
VVTDRSNQLVTRTGTDPKARCSLRHTVRQAQFLTPKKKRIHPSVPIGAGREGKREGTRARDDRCRAAGAQRRGRLATGATKGSAVTLVGDSCVGGRAEQAGSVAGGPTTDTRPVAVSRTSAAADRAPESSVSAAEVAAPEKELMEMCPRENGPGSEKSSIEMVEAGECRRTSRTRHGRRSARACPVRRASCGDHSGRMLLVWRAAAHADAAPTEGRCCAAP